MVGFALTRSRKKRKRAKKRPGTIPEPFSVTILLARRYERQSQCRRTKACIHPQHPTDIGILAVALRALAGFSSRAGPCRQEFASRHCDVSRRCIGEPGALGSLRVEAVDIPKRLNWYCSLHRGGFNGIAYALGKHEAAKPNGGSEVVPIVSPPCTCFGSRPCVPAIKKPFAARLAGGKYRITAEFRAIERSMCLRCRRCLPCKNRRNGTSQARTEWQLGSSGCSACDGAKTRCAGGCAPVPYGTARRRRIRERN